MKRFRKLRFASSVERRAEIVEVVAIKACDKVRSRHKGVSQSPSHPALQPDVHYCVTLSEPALNRTRNPKNGEPLYPVSKRILTNHGIMHDDGGDGV